MSFNTLLPQGYWIKKHTEANGNIKLNHYFCGQHNVKGASCPNCKKPLLRFLSLNLEDTRLVKLKNSEFNSISLFFCWTCKIAQNEFYYQIIDNVKIKLIRYTSGGVDKDFPYKNYPIYFPLNHAKLIELSDLEQETISKINADEIKPSEVRKIDKNLSIPQHQIGGEPYLPQQELDKLICPKCSNDMPFFVSIGNDSWGDKRFTSNDYVEVVYYYCERCSIIGSLQQCD
ncbi:MAG: hypothetical protein WBM78_16420 [Desulfobacterales bacterium]